MNRTERQRAYIFVALVILGLCYVALFALFTARSDSFIERQGLEAAVSNLEDKRLALPYREAIAAGRSGLSLLGPGWHPAEEWGVWSSGRQAWLIVPSPMDPSGRLRFELQVTAFVHSESHPKQTVRIRCGEDELAAYEFEAQQPSKRIEFSLDPSDCVEKRGVMALEILIANPASPASLGLGKDARSLGIALQSIAITQVVVD